MKNIKKHFSSAATINADAPDFQKDSGVCQNPLMRVLVNGYAYAAGDIREDSDFPQPGGAAGIEYDRDAILELMCADGMAKANGTMERRKGFYRVGVVLQEADYLPVREDGDGGWSYKKGVGPVVRTDRYGATIVMPHLSEWGEGSRFLGYVYVPAGGLRVGRVRRTEHAPDSGLTPSP